MPFTISFSTVEQSKSRAAGPLGQSRELLRRVCLITVGALALGWGECAAQAAGTGAMTGPGEPSGASALQTNSPLNPAYTIISLGTLGGTASAGYGVNNAGQVTGASRVVGSSEEHPFLYSEGLMTDLGNLGGTLGHGYGINDAGQVTGYSYVMGNTSPRAYVYSDGVMTDLGTLGGPYSYGHSINDAGQVAGYSYLTGGSIFHAFVYSGGVMTDLGTLGGTSSIGYDINNTGQVTGYSHVSGSIFHAFVYSGGVMTDLGTLGGANSIGYGMNDAGQVTGASYLAGGTSYRAFVHADGVMTNLGTLGGERSFGYGINEAGQVVGRSQITGSVTYHAFLHSGGVMHDLNDLVGPSPIATNIVTYANGNPINDWGQITAQGVVGGLSQALLLNPVDPLTSVTGDSRNTKFVAGMNYNKFTETTHSGGLGTAVMLLDGVVGSGGSVSHANGGYGRNRDVEVSFTTTGTLTGFASEVVTLTGTFEDTFVLSLSYDESLFDDEVFLAWWNGADWVSVIHGNTGLGNAPTYFNRAYDPLTDFILGYHGLDAATNTVWAVINHNSDFAVLSSAVPEPSRTLLLLGGVAVLAMRRRRGR